LCGADSAGISVERPNKTASEYYHWIATAGDYAGFLNAVLPQYPSACGVCLERGRPQLFRVSQRFFDLMGIKAATVTDGILLPWQVDGLQGTVWVMAHGRDAAFDGEDLKLLQVLAEFAAMGIRQRRQQKLVVDKASAAAARAMADDLAHKINNPLQSLTNILYLASEGHHGESARAVGRQALDDLERLSALVRQLLQLPIAPKTGFS
jgi:signal transduction histidine kinase